MSDLKLAITSPGKIGPLESWNVNEFATPVSPAESAGGAGSIGGSAVDRGNGILIAESASTATHPELGEISGFIKNPSQTGQRISFSQNNKLARFNAVRNMPPMVAASVPGALELALQQTASDDAQLRFTQDDGYYWSLSGHTIGYDGQGVLAAQSEETVTYEYYRPDLTAYQEASVVINTNTLGVDGMLVLGGNVFAENVTGDNFKLVMTGGIFSGTQHPESKLRLQGKTILDGADMVFSIQGLPAGPSDGDFEIQVSAQIDYSASDLILTATYRSGGMAGTVTTATASLASLDLDEELAFRVYFGTMPLAAFPYGRFVLNMGVCNTSDFATIVSEQIEFTPDLDPIWYAPWTIDGNVRALWYRVDDANAGAPYEWTSDITGDWENFDVPSETPTLGKPSIGFEGSVWEWLQQACTAYGWEIYLNSDDEISSRPIGSTSIVFSNPGAIPTMTPQFSGTGRRIDIEYTGATVVNSGEVYSALEDDNRILRVDAGLTVTTKIETKAYLTSVLSPSRTTTYPNPVGTYYVVDSDDLPIVAAQWEDYGGSLSVTIDPDSAGVLNVVLVGPVEEIPGTNSPYSIAVSDGENQYAALSVVGSGVVSSPGVLELQTGADPLIVVQEVAGKVTNAFIADREMAYDAGVWASLDASGPSPTLSLTVPTRELVGFGISQGSIFRYEQAFWRITNASISQASTSITASMHVTVGDFDTAWSGEDVGDYDAAWDGYTLKDQRVLPLLNSPEAEIGPPVSPP